MVTEGFSHYFIVYSGWTASFTDFLRPGVNLILRVEQIAFGQHYALYFTALYFAQFVVCALIILIASRAKASFSWLIAIGILGAITPAFLGVDLLNAVDPFDVWCGLFAMAAFYCVLKAQYVLAIVFCCWRFLQEKLRSTRLWPPACQCMC